MTLFEKDRDEALLRLMVRRFILLAGAGTAVVALGGIEYVLSDDLTPAARAETRSDDARASPRGRERSLDGSPWAARRETALADDSLVAHRLDDRPSLAGP